MEQEFLTDSSTCKCNLDGGFVKTRVTCSLLDYPFVLWVQTFHHQRSCSFNGASICFWEDCRQARQLGGKARDKEKKWTCKGQTLLIWKNTNTSEMLRIPN
jgi:hypothetical protein